jgi:hypothetical protein
MGAGVAALTSLGPIGCAASASSPRPRKRKKPDPVTTPMGRAYTFLDRMMDSYASGTALRLARSFVPTQARDLGDIAFTYDNAVLIIALVKRGRTHDLARAQVLGDSLLFAQQHDVSPDGRLRDSYHGDPFVRADGTPNVASNGSAIGNMAWAGLALAHLYARTRQSRYLGGAKAIGTWINANARDARGAGGYTGGMDQNGLNAHWKSTEHNIDCYALFRTVARFTSSADWNGRARHALALVQAMWDPAERHFWTGTVDDGATINRNPIPEDVQSWSYLATLNPAYTRALAWAEQHLAASPGNFYGVSFSTADLNGVWLEGTAHLAAALKASGQRAAATRYLAAIEYAQRNAQNADGEGIVAASRDGLQTGFGDQYYISLHVGATAWYGIAKLGINPFRV